MSYNDNKNNNSDYNRKKDSNSDYNRQNSSHKRIKSNSFFNEEDFVESENLYKQISKGSSSDYSQEGTSESRRRNSSGRSLESTDVKKRSSARNYKSEDTDDDIRISTRSRRYEGTNANRRSNTRNYKSDATETERRSNTRSRKSEITDSDTRSNTRNFKSEDTDAEGRSITSNRKAESFLDHKSATSQKGRHRDTENVSKTQVIRTRDDAPDIEYPDNDHSKSRQKNTGGISYNTRNITGISNGIHNDYQDERMPGDFGETVQFTGLDISDTPHARGAYGSNRTRRTQSRKPKDFFGPVYLNGLPDSIVYYSQYDIPDVGNELTANAVLNNTYRVRKRAHAVEKAGINAHKEPKITDTESVFSPESRTETVPDYFTIEDRAVPISHRRHKYPQDIMDYDGSPSMRVSKDNKKRSKRYKPRSAVSIVINFLVLALIIAMGIVGFNTAKRVFDDSPMDPSNLSKIEYTIDETATDDSVGKFLVANNLVEDEFVYKIRAIFFDADYEPGTYELSPSFSTEKIINILSGVDYTTDE